MTDDILSWSSLRRFLGLYTLFYRPHNQKKPIDLHPDFIKYAVSEHFLYLSLKKEFLKRTPLAGSRDAAAKAKARAQVSARAALNAREFSTPPRKGSV